MLNIITLLIGSILLGFGVNWQTGLGIFIIGFGWHQTFMGTVNNLYAATIRNLLQIYNKIPSR